MFVHPSRLRTPGAIAVTLATCSLMGCDDPVASTDLRSEGDPEVLTVLVMNDADSLVFETATFCAPGDEKRPGFVGGTPAGGVNICDPEDLSVGADPVVDAVPTDLAQGGTGTGGWYIRVQFDELLDPNVEELIEIVDPTTMLGTGQFTGSLANTQPFTITCGGAAIGYDGYYSPSGNSVTWPLGPSLVAFPTDRAAIPTGAECTVQINNTFTDKQGATVPAEQLGGGGEYAFNIAPLELAAVDPAPAAAPGMEAVIVPEAPVSLVFNAFIDPASLTAEEVVITEHTMDDCTDAGTVVGDAAKVIEGGDGVIQISVNNGGADLAWKEMTAYSITFSDTNAVADLGGGPGALPAAADFTLCFNTDMAAP